MALAKMKNVGIVVAAAVLFSAAALVFSPHAESQLPFDAQVWKHAGEDDDSPHSIPDLWKHHEKNVRLKMVTGLIPRLMGSRKAEVEKLLGEPIRDLGLYSGDYYYYGLGTKARFGDTDGIWLCLRFNNDRVNAVQIAHD